MKCSSGAQVSENHSCILGMTMTMMMRDDDATDDDYEECYPQVPRYLTVGNVVNVGNDVGHGNDGDDDV